MGRDLVGRVAVRGVAAGREHDGFDLTRHAAGDRLDLRARAVGIVIALEDQDGASHVCEAALDVPSAEARVEPRVVPAAEGDVDVRAVMLELRAEVACLVRDLRRGDARDGHVLDVASPGSQMPSPHFPSRQVKFMCVPGPRQSVVPSCSV